jgi:hypothetical protein
MTTTKTKFEVLSCETWPDEEFLPSGEGVLMITTA